MVEKGNELRGRGGQEGLILQAGEIVAMFLDEAREVPGGLLLLESHGAEGKLDDAYPEENFRIVAPPIGATVTMLPEDTKEKKVGEDTYFVYDKTWYKPFYSGDDVLYMVSTNPEASPADKAPAGKASE